MLKIMVWKQTISCIVACFLAVNYIPRLIWLIWLLNKVPNRPTTREAISRWFQLYLQNFLSANSQCWWNTPLTAATRALKYAGHVAPGMLLVTAEPCALEILRGAYARSVLKPPATYTISSVGEFWLFCLLFLSFGIKHQISGARSIQFMLQDTTRKYIFLNETSFVLKRMKWKVKVVITVVRRCARLEERMINVPLNAIFRLQ